MKKIILFALILATIGVFAQPDIVKNSVTTNQINKKDTVRVTINGVIYGVSAMGLNQQSPMYNLHVHGSTSVGIGLTVGGDSSAIDGLRMINTTTESMIDCNDPIPFYLKSQGTEALEITTGSKVKISQPLSNDNALNEVMVRAADGEVKYRDVSTIGGGVSETYVSQSVDSVRTETEDSLQKVRQFVLDKGYITNSLYTGSGSLSGTTTVTTGANNLFFNGTGGIGLRTGSLTAGFDIDALGRMYLKTTTGDPLTVQFSDGAGFSKAVFRNNVSTPVFQILSNGGLSGSYINMDGNKILMGTSAGASIIGAGGNNYLFGYQSGVGVTTGIEGIGIGVWSLKSATDCDYCIAIGREALGGSNITGDYNIGIGYLSGSSLTTGHDNTLIGRNAGPDIETGAFNTFIGTNAGFDAQGSSNTAIGYGSLQGAIGAFVGSSNVGIGTNSGAALTTGTGNVLIGSNAGATLTTESNRLMIDNSATSTPLLDGDFANDSLTIHGLLSIGNPTTTGYSFPAAEGLEGQILRMDGSGGVTWAQPYSHEDAVISTLTDTSDQFCAATLPQAVTFNTNDLLGDSITHTVGDSILTINTSQKCTFTFQPQCKRTSSGTVQSLKFWIEKDTGAGFSPIPRAQIIVELSSTETSVQSIEWTEDINAGDKIKFMMLSSIGGSVLGIDFTAAGTYGTVTPSTILTIR